MATQKECFVYIQLPGSVKSVVCGRFTWESIRHGAAIGRFFYGRQYRARHDAVPIDPIHLPLSTEIFETTKLEGVFGALRDAAPDAWGRRIIERFAAQGEIDEMEYLLQSPQDGAGALTFGRGNVPPGPSHKFNRVVKLDELRKAARIIETQSINAPISPQLLELLRPGTSLGGARPKNVVEDDDGLWIAKFPQQGDRWNSAVVEAAMLKLAGYCGIRVPATRIEWVDGEAILLVKRFDRERLTPSDPASPYLRYRMVSALTVLDADESPTDLTNWSYVNLSDELRRWSSKIPEDRLELFRRVAFNCLISNVDDHPRNHALIAPRQAWQLAPAFDLTPNPRQGQDERRLAMECGSFGRVARRDNLLSQAGHFGLQKDEANEIIDSIRDTIGRSWRDEVLRQGGNVRDCETVAAAFTYPGFEYTTQL